MAWVAKKTISRMCQVFFQIVNQFGVMFRCRKYVNQT